MKHDKEVSTMDKPKSNEQPTEDVCKWRYDEETGKFLPACCGILLADEPWNYCPNCGKTVEEV